MKPLNCIVIGCGAIVEFQYVPAIKALKQLNVLALVDPNPSRVEAIAAKFPGARSLTHIGDVRADFAIVASPAAYHAEQAIAALNAGMHVLCEKPMAANAAEAERMVEAARRTGKLLAVGLFRRFFPATRTINDCILNATLGKAKRYSIAEGGEFNWPAVSATFFQKQHAGGGVLLDLGSHTLDLVQHWFGEPTKVSYEDDADGGLEATSCVQMEHPGGTTGEVRVSRDWRTANRYFIEFERGWIAWRPSEASKLEIGLVGGTFVGTVDLAEPANDWGEPGIGQPSLTYRQCFTEQLAQFVEAICTGGQPVVTGMDGLRNLKLIERCYELKRLGGPG